MERKGKREELKGRGQKKKGASFLFFALLFHFSLLAFTFPLLPVFAEDSQDTEGAAEAATTSSSGQGRAITQGKGGTANGGSQGIEADEFTGAATHSITIPVPPSRGGVEPNLSLTYNSHRKNPNSWVGYGWEFDIGQIMRVPEKGQIRRTIGERFEVRFGGQSETLVPVTTPEGDHVTVPAEEVGLSPTGIQLHRYRSSIESSFNIYLHVVSSSYPDVSNDGGWIVIDKSGRRFYFGYHSRTRDEYRYGVYHLVDRWLLEGVIDPNGNAMTVTYGDDLLPERIEYQDVVITFTKESRGVYFPIFRESFLPPNALTQRLSTVEVRASGNFISRFHLSYSDPHPDTGIVQLTAIRQVDESDNNLLPPTTFDYYPLSTDGSEGPRLEWSSTPLTRNASLSGISSPDGAAVSRKVDFLDMNGDALVDRVSIRGPNQVVVEFGDGQTFFDRGGTSRWDRPASFCNGASWCTGYLKNTTGTKLFLIDMNGDHLPDQVRDKDDDPDDEEDIANDGFTVLYNTGSGWDNNPAFWPDPAREYYSDSGDEIGKEDIGRVTKKAGLIDMNGDGLVDRVVGDRSAGTFHVHRNNGNGFDGSAESWPDPIKVNRSFDGPEQGDDPFPQGQGLISENLNGESEVFVQIRDFNGDGLPDRMWKAVFYAVDEPRDGDHDYDEVGRGFMVALNRNGQGWAQPAACPAEEENVDPRCENFQRFNNYDVLGIEDPTPRTADKGLNDKRHDWVDINGDGYLDRIVKDVESDNDQPSSAFRVFFYKGHNWSADALIRLSEQFTLGDPIADGRFRSNGEEESGSYRGHIFEMLGVDTDSDPADDEFYLHTFIRDMNGDGYPDRVTVDGGQYRIHPLLVNPLEYSDSPSWWDDRKVNQPAFALRSINDGLGNETRVEYQGSSRQIERHSNHRFLPMNLNVVRKIYSRDYTAPSGSRSVTYNYWGGNFYVHRGDEYTARFNGFQRVEKGAAPLPGETWRSYTTTTFYHQDRGDVQDPAAWDDRIDPTGYAHFSLSGRPYKQVVSEVGSGLNVTQTNTWVVANQADAALDAELACGGKCWVPRQTRTVKEVQESSDSAVRRTSVETQYDSFNNLTNEIHRGQSDEVLLEKVSTFYPEGHFDPVLKIRDRVETQYQTKDGVNFRTKSFDYDAVGNPRDEEFHLDDARRVGINRSFYPEGNLQEITDVDGITKRLSYDAGNLFPRLERVLRDGGSSLDTTRVFDRLTGEVKDETGPHGIGWRKVTDNLGRPLDEYVRDAAGAERLSRKYQYEWLTGMTVESSSGVTLLKTSIWEPQEGFSETDVGGRPLKVSYSDTSGQVLQDCSYSERGNYRRVLFRVSNGGRLERQTEPTFVDDCSFVSAIPVGARVLERQKDFQGRVVLEVPPMGDGESPVGDIHYTYSTTADGFLQKVTLLPGGRSRVEVFDASERLIRVTDPAGGVLEYRYNAVGDLERVIQDGVTVVTIAYDLLGRKERMIDANLGTWTYDYDDLGRLEWQTDNKGQKIHFIYTTLNRVERKEIFSAGDVLEKYEVYSYDSGDASHNVLAGELYQVEEFSAEGTLLRRTRFGYDSSWRRTNKISRFIAGVGTFEQTISHDFRGKVLSTTYPGGETSYYRYGRTGGLEKVCSTSACDPASGEIYYSIDSGSAYDVFGSLQREDFGNGVATSYDYFPNSHRLRSRRILKGDSTFSQRTYRYDAFSNIRILGNPLGAQGSGALPFTEYDTLDRLTSYRQQSSTNPIPIVLDYHPNGNMKKNSASFGDSEYLYNDAAHPHAVTDIGDKHLSYDANGNLISDPSRTLTYNAQNQLTRVTMTNGVAVDYDYDYTGARVSKKVRREDLYHHITEATTHYLGEAMEIIPPPSRGGGEGEGGSARLILHISAGGQRIATKALGTVGELLGPAAGSLRHTGINPGLSFQVLIPWLMLLGLLFLLASFRKVDMVSLSNHRPLSSPPRENVWSGDPVFGTWSDVFDLRTLASRFTFHASRSLLSLWSSYTQSMHEALKLLHHGMAFKLVAIALTFLTVVQFPLTSMASHVEVAEDTITDPQYFYYQHGDHLGSSHVLTEGKSESRHSGIVYKKGDLLQRFEYAPFGQESFALNPNLKFDPSYTGQTYDIETGLYYYKSRYYDPKLARFIQPDTIIPDAKNLQAYNRYSYVSNNPLKYTDPSGHSFVDWFKRIFGAVIGVLIGLAATVITLGGLGVAGATFGAMFANATLGQLVAAGAVAGAIAGSVTGAITGGHMGALMGAAFGAAGGALGPLGNHALSGLSEGVRIAIFGAVGASLSYATGGWKGLATFGAAFATGAGIYGIGKLSGRNSSRPLSSGFERKDFRFEYEGVEIGPRFADSGQIMSDADMGIRASFGFHGEIAVGAGGEFHFGQSVNYANAQQSLYEVHGMTYGLDASVGYELAVTRGPFIGPPNTFSVYVGAPVSFGFSIYYDPSTKIFGGIGVGAVVGPLPISVTWSNTSGNEVQIKKILGF